MAISGPFTLKEYKLGQLERSPLIIYLREKTYDMVEPNTVLDYVVRIDDLKREVPPITHQSITPRNMSEVELASMYKQQYGERELISSKQRFMCFCKINNWRVSERYRGRELHLSIHSDEVFTFRGAGV